jgi:hypothetical protein
MSIKVTKNNYPTYKKVYEIISQRLYKDLDGKLPPETNPVIVLNRWEAENKSMAIRGLQAGLNDCLSSVSHYPKEIVADINAELEKNELPNIYNLSGLIYKTIKQVLKTGKIKTIDQYYIVKELLDDTASKISADERYSLSNSINNYETTTSRQHQLSKTKAK